MSDRVLVIAEAGVNHNGSLLLAGRLIEAAAAAGADVVKFQTFKAEKVVAKNTPKAAYQSAATGTAEDQLAMIRQLELSDEDFRGLAAQAEGLGIEFLSTPFDEQSAEFLVGDIGVQRMKIPSGEITNGPLILAVARSGLPIILSTGMANLEEIEEALGIIAFGLDAPPGEVPSRKAFQTAFEAAMARGDLARLVTLLHCTTEYPAPFEDIHLRAMDAMRERFALPVGYSDHTVGIAISLAAAARGGAVLEKHFTLDRSLPGPDHAASLEPSELGAMVSGVRAVEAGLGEARKVCTLSEEKNLPIARRSLVAARPIAAGETLTADCMTAKRPGGGVSPMRYWDLLGTPARRAYVADEALDQ
ncbi:MAG: N-acetylneuraminate synthase [Rhodospirillaceae bacterium]|nr:N-acetylneuraminate synthase [Rhodospirillaceae bacterium]